MVEIVTQDNQRQRTIILVSFLSVALLLLSGVLRFWQLDRDPAVNLLKDEKNAPWIKVDNVFELLAYNQTDTVTYFHRTFTITAPVYNAKLTIMAMKSCEVFLDRRKLYSSGETFDNWKRPIEINLPSRLEPGEHNLRIKVKSRYSFPALQAYSKDLDINTGLKWIASLDGIHWKHAWPASKTKMADISQKFKSVSKAFVNILPFLSPVFICSFIVIVFRERLEDRFSIMKRFHPDSGHIRLAIMILWLILGVNNLFKLPGYYGFDAQGHFNYIQYILDNRTLPLATDGIQMFQAPLYYILSAPLYMLSSTFLPNDVNVIRKVLVVIPLLAGLVHIEIVYRTSKLVFPDERLLQSLATVTAALIPMHIYICQAIGNEPLAACLIGLFIYLCLTLVIGQPDTKGYLFFALAGSVWGLALLTKVTAVLLVPFVFLLLVFHKLLTRIQFKYLLAKAGLLFGSCFIVSGWYYIRNWIELGRPFVGGWDVARGIDWWQDPGYRNLSMLFSFGKSLTYPIHSGAAGLFDGLYSTFWLDGFLGGIPYYELKPPWNYDFALSCIWLSVVPSVLMITGLILSFFNKKSESKSVLMLSVICILVFLLAVWDLYIRLPIYSTAKATYTLGLLVFYGLLIAKGAEPLLRNKLIRAILLSLMLCWAITAFVGYFVV